MKILNGEAVPYMASGTNSSMIRLVVTRDIPQPTPAIKRLILSSQMFMNCVKTAPTRKMHPVMSKVLRRPLFISFPAVRAPTHAPIL